MSAPTLAAAPAAPAAPAPGRHVCVGGTFDRLHKGHEVLLIKAAAALAPNGRLFVGVTGDVMLKDKSLRELIEPAGERIIHVRNFLRPLLAPGQRLATMALTDPFGPSITDVTIDTIVVSPETSMGAEMCNDRRATAGFPAMAVVFSDLVGTPEQLEPTVDQKLSSSGLRKAMLGRLLDGGRLMCKRLAPGTPYTIGLSGGIACGKTTVVTELARLLPAEIETIDCDKLGHAAYKNGTKCHGEVVEAFGAAVLAEGGEIDRKALGAMVFAEPANMARLNGIVWPHIAAEVRGLISRSTAAVCVVEAAILLEAGWETMVDEVWLVTTQRKTAISRLMARNNLDEVAAIRRVDGQASAASRIQKAHVLICTDGDLSTVQAQLMDAWDLLRPRQSVTLTELARVPRSLPRRWAELAAAVGVDPAAAAHWWRTLRDRHCENHRRYHDLSHLEDMFEHYDTHKPRLARPELVALAIFFHDAVYAPAAAPRQNELDSASLFRSFWASALPQPPAGFGDAGEVVSAWIERTADHMDGPATGDLAYFLDFDLGVLGSDPAGYTAYAAAIRLEYQHVQEDAFVSGRTAVLRKFTERSSLYFTDAFKGLDNLAKRNLKAEMESLARNL